VEVESNVMSFTNLQESELFIYMVILFISRYQRCVLCFV